MLKIPADEPLIKGRLTIYAFARHFDYGEIGQMLENHDIPAESRGHWQYDIVDAYAAIVPPSKKDDYSLDAMLAEQIAAVYVANQGTIPNWFADGSGKAVAAKINPKDSRVRTWENRLGPALAHLKKPTDILENKLSAADERCAGVWLRQSADEQNRPATIRCCRPCTAARRSKPRLPKPTARRPKMRWKRGWRGAASAGKPAVASR